MNMSQGCCIYRVRSNNMNLQENKNKIWNKMFPFKVYFSRKSSLETYQIYLNVANSGLDNTK